MVNILNFFYDENYQKIVSLQSILYDTIGICIVSRAFRDIVRDL